MLPTGGTRSKTTSETVFAEYKPDTEHDHAETNTRGPREDRLRLVTLERGDRLVPRTSLRSTQLQHATFPVQRRSRRRKDQPRRPHRCRLHRKPKHRTSARRTH